MYSVRTVKFWMHMVLQNCDRYWKFTDNFYKLTKNVLYVPEEAAGLTDTEDVNDDDDDIIKFRKIQRELLQHIRLKNQTYRLKHYEECAVASEIVSALINKVGVAATEAEAIDIGQTLMELNLMRDVGYKGNIIKKSKSKFSNEKGMFLHFINFESVTNVQTMWESNDYEMKSKLLSSKTLDVKDRSKLGKTHKQCFRGSDWVKALKQEKMALTKLHAKEIGTKLITLGYVEHVLKEQDRLKNHNNLWYRFK